MPPPLGNWSRYTEPAAAGTTFVDSGLTPEQILKHIEAEQPYLDPTYQLQQLAASLQASPKQLSQVINQKLEMNFFGLINGYSVKEAQ